MRPPNLIHVDPLDKDVRSSGTDIGIATSQTVAAGFDAVWVLTDRTLYRVHPGTDELRPFVVMPLAAGIATYSLALDDHIWVGDSDGTIVRMDPASGARDQAETGLSVGPMTAIGNGLWVTDILANELTQVDPESLRRTGKPIEVPGSIDQIVGRDDLVWVLDRQVGTITRVDTSSKAVSGSARVGDDGTDMAVGLGAVWVGDGGGSLYRVDALTLDVEEFPRGAEVLGVAVDEADGSIWVYLGRDLSGE